MGEDRRGHWAGGKKCWGGGRETESVSLHITSGLIYNYWETGGETGVINTAVRIIISAPALLSPLRAGGREIIYLAIVAPRAFINQRGGSGGAFKIRDSHDAVFNRIQSGSPTYVSAQGERPVFLSYSD